MYRRWSCRSARRWRTMRRSRCAATCSHRRRAHARSRRIVRRRGVSDSTAAASLIRSDAVRKRAGGRGASDIGDIPRSRAVAIPLVMPSGCSWSSPTWSAAARANPARGATLRSRPSQGLVPEDRLPRLAPSVEPVKYIGISEGSPVDDIAKSHYAPPVGVKCASLARVCVSRTGMRRVQIKGTRHKPLS